MELSLILPAYNEKERIRKAVKSVKSSLKEITDSYEIIIAEDGSTDGTDKIAEGLSKKDKRIIHLHTAQRLGRGKALNIAFRHAKGDILAYIDVDLATNMNHLKELINSIKYDGYDFATGSRMLKESDVKRSPKREIASRCYNYLTRLFLKSKIKDHQCGFKAFRKKPLMDILDKIKDTHWFWDTELLVTAQKAGYNVKEFPVKWRASKATTVDFTRDVFGMGSRIISMWLDSLKYSNTKKRKRKIIGLLIGIGIILGLAGMVGYKEVIATITNASLTYILLASSIFVASLFIRGKRFDRILKGTNETLGLEFSTKMVICSQWANLVLPARMGDFLRAVLIKRFKKIEYSKGIAALFTERVFDIISIILLGFISTSYIIRQNEYIMPGWVISTMNLLVAIALLLTLITLTIMSRPGSIESVTKKILKRIMVHDIYTESIKKSIETFVKNINSTIKDRKTFVAILTLSLGVWLMETLIAYTVALSMNLNLPVEIIFLAVSLGNLTKAVPNTPNALGTYEAALSGVLIASGAPASLAFSIALIDHFIKNMITFIAGSYTITSLNLKRKEITTDIITEKHKTATI